ncbi:hypothetical protein ACFX2G_034775 [Malus domestica]
MLRSSTKSQSFTSRSSAKSSPLSPPPSSRTIKTRHPHPRPEGVAADGPGRFLPIGRVNVQVHPVQDQTRRGSGSRIKSESCGLNTSSFHG